MALVDSSNIRKARVLLQFGGIIFLVQLIYILWLWGKVEWTSGGLIVIRTEIIHDSGADDSSRVDDRVSAFNSLGDAAENLDI